MKQYLLWPILLGMLQTGLEGVDFSSKARNFTLANGMTFYVYERHEIPTFAGVIMAKVGSVDEQKGETGMAHFFEHLAFKGTPIIGTKDYAKEKPILDQIDRVGEALSAEYARGKHADPERMKALRDKLRTLQDEQRKYAEKGELEKIYSENGGEALNASTANDTTQYYVMLPANRLELWFLIESERFKYPTIREFYSERDVIAEERRMWEDNNPGGYLEEEFENIAFVLHPYRHSVVGYMEDIQTHTRPEALKFYQRFYVPNNLVAAVVGDVQLEEVKRLAGKYFADIPRGNDPPRTEVLEPKQKGERRVTVEYDAEPRVKVGYHMPAYPDKDNLVLELTSQVLSGGLSSRMVRDLVTRKRIAVSVYAYGNDPGERYPALFAVGGMPRYPHTPEELEQALYAHLDKLKTEPVKPEELEKALNQREAALYQGFDSNIYIAVRMLWGVVLYGDIDAEFKRLEALKKITPEDILDTSRRIFIASNRTVGILHRKEKGGAQ